MWIQPLQQARAAQPSAPANTGSKMFCKTASSQGCLHQASRRAAPCVHVVRSRSLQPCKVVARMSESNEGSRSIMVKNKEELPFPWSERDPYRLPVSIERVQRMLMSNGWQKPWVEQIVDRIMKNMLRTTEDRASAVIEYLTSLGLKQDEICNMASISVVLLGLNPDTRLRTVVDYLKTRGVPDESIPDLVLKHPRIFEYRWEDNAGYLSKGRARIQVDVLPLGPEGSKVASVNYFRDIATFLESPVSPPPPAH